LDSFQVISNIAYSSNEQKQDIKLNCLQAHKFSMQFFFTKQYHDYFVHGDEAVWALAKANQSRYTYTYIPTYQVAA
jgi:hypothetical protein